MARDVKSVNIPFSGGAASFLLNLTPLNGKKAVGVLVAPRGSVNGNGATFDVIEQNDIDIVNGVGKTLGTVTVADSSKSYSDSFEVKGDHIIIAYSPGAETAGSFDVAVIYKT